MHVEAAADFCDACHTDSLTWHRSLLYTGVMATTTTKKDVIRFIVDVRPSSTATMAGLRLSPTPSSSRRTARSATASGLDSETAVRISQTFVSRVGSTVTAPTRRTSTGVSAGTTP